MTRRSINVTQFWLTIILFTLPGVAFLTAAYIRFRTSFFAPTGVDKRSYVLFALLVTLLWALVVEYLRLNRIPTILGLRTGIITAAKASAYCTILSLTLVFFYRIASFARVFVVIGCALLFVFSVFVIHLFRGILYAIDRSPNGRFPIAILGADDRAAEVANHLSKAGVARCKIACFVALPGQSSRIRNFPVLAWDRLEDVVEQFHCAEILVCLPSERLKGSQTILQAVRHLCIPSRVVLDIGEGVFVPERVFDYYGVPLLDVRPYPVDTIAYAVGKRIFDIVFSSIVLLLVSPLMLLIGCVVKLTSEGPVFFTQERISLNGHRFKMIKFRSMYAQTARAANTNHTSRADRRITPIGRLLRRTSFDELPQFFNVLKGDMSVVGPRPELTFFVQKFKQEIPRYMARHSVKCGITGWAQVNGLRGSDTSIGDRIDLDLYYMQNWSMLLDFRIIFMTVINGIISSQAY